MFSTSNYIYIAYFSVSLLFVTFLLLSLAYICSRKDYYSEKVSAYECGFEPFHGIRRPTNTNFYNIALLFLLFDIEIVLLLPGIAAFGYMATGQLWLYVFLLLLWLGYVFELQTDSLYIIR